MQQVNSQKTVPDAYSSTKDARGSIFRRLQAAVRLVVKEGSSQATFLYEGAVGEVAVARRAAVDAFASLRSTAISCLKEGQNIVDGAKEGAARRASAVTHAVRSAPSSARQRLSTARVGLCDALASARRVADEEYNALRSAGPRTWTAQRSRAVAAAARRSVVELRSRSVEALAGVRARLVALADSGRSQALALAGAATKRVNFLVAGARGAATGALRRVRSTANSTKAKAIQLSGSAREVATDAKVQATVVGVAGGAATMGAGGAMSGLAVGSAAGAVVGLVPAVFTLGLSIPVGAAIGGGAGLLTGAAVGSAAGAMGGGAAGFKVYTERDQLKAGVQQAFQKAGEGADYVKDSITTSTDFVKCKASQVRSRVSRSVAGGA